MRINGIKPTTTPRWIQVAIAVVLATVLTWIAFSMTNGGGAPDSGKGVLYAAILVIPLIFAAKLGWTYGVSMAVAFVTYFFASYLFVWFVTSKASKQPPYRPPK
jgi:hypothetical protein